MSATSAARVGVRRLVDVGQDRHAGRRPHVREDRASLPAGPGPRNDPPDVRFALSYDALKTYGTPARSRDVADRERRVDGVRSLSMTQGPAMRTSGLPPPIVSPPN